MNTKDSIQTPVRILHVVTCMGRGGLETMIMNHYRNVDRAMIQFDFLTHRNFKADYNDEIKALGGKIFSLPRLVPWDKKYHKALDDFFADHPEYKIVHVHQDCLSSVILKVAKKHGVPIRIAHSHSSSQDRNLKYPIKLYFRKQIPNTATHLFACGKEAGDWMFRGEYFRIINNAIDSGIYVYNEEIRQKVRHSLGLKKDSFVIGHVGRFNTVKNHTFLIEVFKKIKKKKSNTYLLLVGGGELKEEVEKKAKQLGIIDDVIFAGVRSDVPDLLQAMDCFVFPSLYEGIPISLIEAQASGLSCIVSNEVSRESSKTELVKYVSLSESADKWAEEILKTQGALRYDTSKQIIESGYDIRISAQWLQNFYIEQWKEL